MTDHDKLAREMWAAEGIAYSHMLNCAAIAIAYADRRVAEAVGWVKIELEDMQQTGCTCAPEREIDPEEKECVSCMATRLLSALSPAREGGGDE